MTESIIHETWRLTPEGAAIHLESTTAVVADLHLGYEWARAAGGDCVPTHSLDETLAKLKRMFTRARVTRLLVAGDLVESHRPCRRTREDVERLAGWLAENKVELVVLAGNHDRSLQESGIDPLHAAPLAETACVAGWTIAHGHRPIDAPRTVSGHLHPVLCFEGVTAPCFIIAPGMIVLPAFSANAAGRDVASGPLPRKWREADTRCIASADNSLLDLGPLARLRERRCPANRRFRKKPG